jgi:sulfur-carrier protein
MAVRVLFFGKLQDLAGASEVTMPARATVSELAASLGEEMADALRDPRVRVAVNGRVGESGIKDGDEVAFMSAVSGG